METNGILKIKIGEAQPINCDHCQSKEGYQYSDYISLHYTTVHDSEGNHEGGQYSESCKHINKAITPYCENCGNKLKFKLIRETNEEVKSKVYAKKRRN